MDTEILKSLISISQNKRVLYIEDDENVRQQTLKILGVCFQNIVAAPDGYEGLALFETQSFDIIFTDINMPKMDGIAFICEIRKRDALIPIVVFSAYDTTEYFLKTIHYGISGYILKPFQLKDIVAVLEKVMNEIAVPHSSAHCMELIDGYYWERATQALCLKEEEIKLTKNEIALFELLTSSKQRVFTSEEIEIAVFDDDTSDNKRVRNLLCRLRQKLECELIVSIYGQGYKLRWLHH